jgi:hypothetical protein
VWQKQSHEYYQQRRSNQSISKDNNDTSSEQSKDSQEYFQYRCLMGAYNPSLHIPMREAPKPNTTAKKITSLDIMFTQ